MDSLQNKETQKKRKERERGREPEGSREGIIDLEEVRSQTNNLIYQSILTISYKVTK